MANTMLTAALRYHELGFNVLALAEGGKKPNHLYTDPPHDFKSRRQTVEEVSSLPWVEGGGVALVCGLGVHCLDFDGKDTAVDLQAALQICRELGLGESYPWLVRSGSHKGYHVWVRCEDDFSHLYTGGVKKWYPREGAPHFHHIEHRWKSCYTIAPPSKYWEGDGRLYEFLHGEPTEAPAMVSARDLYAALCTIAQPEEKGGATNKEAEFVNTEDEHTSTAAPVLQEAAVKEAEFVGTVKQHTKTMKGSGRGWKWVDLSSGEELTFEEKAAREDQVKEEIRSRFDLKEEVRAYLGVPHSEIFDRQGKRGPEWRIGREGAKLGGWHVTKDNRTWNQFEDSQGGDCFDFVGFKLYGTRYIPTDAAMWRAVLEEAARLTGVTLPEYRSVKADGREDSSHVLGNTSPRHGEADRKMSKAEAVQEWISQSFKLRWNTMLLRIEFTLHEEEKWEPITDNMEASWRVNFEKHSGSRVGRDPFSDYVRDLAHTTKHQPLEDYFDSLAPYDAAEGDYVKQFADIAQTAHQELYTRHLRKWLVGVYACAYHDAMSQGAKNRNELFLVLSGKQGIGKTTYLRALVPSSLRAYLLEKRIKDTKDSEQLLAQSFLFQDDELVTLSANEMETVKTTLSARSYKFRPPYGKHPEEFPRRVSFCGSTNAREFFRDQTGSRRFLIHDVHRLDFEKLDSFDVSRMWAQVRSLYESGVKHYLSPDEQREVESHNLIFTAPTTEEDLLTKYFEPIKWGAKTAKYYTTTELGERMSYLHDQEHTTIQMLGMGGEMKVRDGVPRFKYDSPAVVQRLGALLHSKGFHKGPRRFKGGSLKNVWAVHEVPRSEWNTPAKEAEGEDEHIPF